MQGQASHFGLLLDWGGGIDAGQGESWTSESWMDSSALAGSCEKDREYGSCCIEIAPSTGIAPRPENALRHPWSFDAARQHYSSNVCQTLPVAAIVEALSDARRLWKEKPS